MMKLSSALSVIADLTPIALTILVLAHIIVSNIFKNAP
jgi:hypothetical protein